MICLEARIAPKLRYNIQSLKILSQTMSILNRSCFDKELSGCLSFVSYNNVIFAPGWVDFGP